MKALSSDPTAHWCVLHALSAAFLFGVSTPFAKLLFPTLRCNPPSIVNLLIANQEKALEQAVLKKRKRNKRIAIPIIEHKNCRVDTLCIQDFEGDDSSNNVISIRWLHEKWKCVRLWQSRIGLKSRRSILDRFSARSIAGIRYKNTPLNPGEINALQKKHLVRLAVLTLSQS